MIGLLDIDSKYPNVALMKLKTYYGDKAKMINPLEAWYCDKIYASSLFDFSVKPSLPEHTIYGGTGFNIKSKLPEDIEKCQPDYSIYPNSEVAMQRYSTGCIRKCPFCVVYEKEGGVLPVKPMDIPSTAKWIYLLDNNFFANPEWLGSIKHLISLNKPVSFEGLDARIITEEQLQWLKKVKIRKQLHFAWDNPREDLTPQFKKIISVINKSKIMVYVLIGYWSTEEEDLYRVETLRSLGIDPFVMPYDKSNRYQRRLARYVNMKAVFKADTWKNYRG